MNCHTLQKHTHTCLAEAVGVLQFHRGAPPTVLSETAGVVHLFVLLEVKQPQNCWDINVV